jgi:hypothetical protein
LSINDGKGTEFPYVITCFNESENEYDENGKEFMWFDAEVEGVAVTTLVTVEVTIPAGYVGTVLIGLSELQYVASLDAANGTVDEVVAPNLIETLVVSDHSFGTKASAQIVTPATCVTPAIYKVQCNYCSVVSETLTVSAGTPNVNAHAYSTEISGYTVDEANGTHTAYYVCTHNAEHKKYDAAVAHDFTTGDCVCGQPKPVTNVTVTYKGAALASAYSVNGQTVTVTHTAACKLGYWDAASGKYVALPATHLTGNTYYFTVPAGVTEVLLVVKGDVTGEGTLNVLDRVRISKALLAKNNANYEAITEAWQVFAANVNDDANFNVLDRVRLSKALLAKNNANYDPFVW